MSIDIEKEVALTAADAIRMLSMVDGDTQLCGPEPDNRGIRFILQSKGGLLVTSSPRSLIDHERSVLETPYETYANPSNRRDQYR